MVSTSMSIVQRACVQLLATLAACLLGPAPAAADELAPDAAALEQFRVEALPVLRQHCFDCHGGGKKLRGHFRITSRAGLIRGGERGPAIDPGNPSRSLLLAMISYRDEEHQMPPSGKLSEAEASILTRWVEHGAPFDPAAEIHPAEDAGEVEHDPTAVNDITRGYWAFRPVSRPQPPPAGSVHPIDAFIDHDLAGAGLARNPPASRRELIRRAYHDLIGLPPTFDEVRAFELDGDANAFEKVVDRLLDSPHHGERWGRHWLDLVRYAESNGYERDGVKPMAHAYRDWVIRAFNDDKPYDRFLAEQLAGDEVEGADASTIPATGFYRLGLWDDEPADRELARYDYLDGIAATAGEAMLGLTIGCARCHDHKIDPIPQRDYYRFLAFFANVSPHGSGDANLVEVSTADEERREAEERAAKAAREAELHARIWQIEQTFLTRARAGRPELVKDFDGPADLVELGYRFYRDTWDTLPDLDGVRAETEGPIASGRFTLSPALRPDAMAMVFHGKLRVPADGDYTFRVTSDDGSRLVVGGHVIGEHRECGEATFSERVPLTAGVAPVELKYFSRSGTPKLVVAWSGPGFEERPLSSGDGPSHGLIPDARQGAPVEWQYTFRDPGEGWFEPEFTARRWRRGAGGFGVDGTPGGVVRTRWPTRDIWLRRRFEARGKIQTLTLHLHHDEDVSVWINGQLVHTASGHLVEYTAVPLDHAIRHLREGDNVIAVHCRHTEGGQYIDVGLGEDRGTKNLSHLIAEHGAAVLGGAARETYFELTGALAASVKNTPTSARRKVLAVAEQGRNATRILLRGNPSLAGDEVEPGFPSVLSPPEPEIAGRGESSGRRLALARWIASDKNPLTARVMVNRLWQFHFGRGLVRSSSNFGRLGDRPTHPELLDWLASELVQSGWRLKPIHKLIMLSQSYQQSSRARADGLEKDPQNDRFWRFDMRRLSAEEIRDGMLAASGRLNLKLHGPSVFPELPAEVLATSSTGAEKWGKSLPHETWRRSVYIFVRRSLLDPLLSTFDLADTDASCAVRFATTVPTQALMLLNSKFVNDQAEAFAARLARERESARERVARGIEVAFGRAPAPREVESGAAMLAEFQAEHGLDAEAALARFALLLLNTNEFVFID